MEFKFIYDRYYKSSKNYEQDKYKHTSIVKFAIKLLNNSVIKVYGYDDIADLICRQCKKNDKILIEGRLDSNMKVEIMKIKKIRFDNIG